MPSADGPRLERGCTTPVAKVDRAGRKLVATRDRVKAIAQRLFAEGGLRSVTTRQIIEAAGQRNMTLINYYFGSKAALIEELISDTVESLVRDRNAKLDALIARGGPKNIREILEILSTPVQTAADQSREDPTSSTTRFIVMLWLNHRSEILKAMNYGFDSGTRRCLRYLRRMSPRMPREVLRERIGLGLFLIISVLVAEESLTVDERSLPNPFGRPSIESALDAVELILSQRAEGFNH
jgi:AcrR family transcriptional regulator